MKPNKCPICGSSEISPFLDLGKQPPANALADSLEGALSMVKASLSLSMCNNCLYISLSENISEINLFNNNTYLSGISKQTRNDLYELASDCIAECFLSPSSKILDIASNDGTLLEYFKERGMQILGIDPSKPAYEAATVKGIPTINDFFKSSITGEIKNRIGKVDLITGANIITHVPDPVVFLVSCKEVLKKEGSIVLEFYYVESIFTNIAFDQVYHEHVSYFNLHNFMRLINNVGLEIYKVKKVSSQGGSLRVFISFPGLNPVGSSISKLLSEEMEGQEQRNRYTDFPKKVFKRKLEIEKIINEAKNLGKKIVGYGAAAKATVLLNYVNVSSDSIICIGDKSPLKQGKFIPGVGIPVVSPDKLAETNADLLIIFSWNLKKEILQFLNNLKWNKNIKAITLMPEIEICEIRSTEMI